MNPTLAGLLAVLFWSSTVAFSRTLSEPLGPLTSGAMIYTLAGLLGLAAQARTSGGLRGLFTLPRRYLLGCGALFAGYELLLYLAVGLAADRAQVLEVGLANYLWPSLTLLLSLRLNRTRARWFLPVGILMALAGAWLAAASGSAGLDGSPFTLQKWLPVLLAALAALLWALYSNLARRWGGGAGNGVPLFLLASGLLFVPLRFLAGEQSAWAQSNLWQLLYMVIFPAWLGYALWDRAMQHGDLVLVTIFSYFTPLLSTLISLIVLGVPLSPQIGLAALLVFGGALLSRWAAA